MRACRIRELAQRTIEALSIATPWASAVWKAGSSCLAMALTQAVHTVVASAHAACSGATCSASVGHWKAFVAAGAVSTASASTRSIAARAMMLRMRCWAAGSGGHCAAGVGFEARSRLSSRHAFFCCRCPTYAVHLARAPPLTHGTGCHGAGASSEAPMGRAVARLQCALSGPARRRHASKARENPAALGNRHVRRARES